MAPIKPISIPQAIQPVTLPNAAQPRTAGFQSVLSAALSHVAQSSAAADSAVSNYLAGGNRELHSTILATQNASLDFELLLQVRNKVVSAYEEIMRMQV